MKQYQELTITDNFLFCKVFGNDPELARLLLERILGKPIKKVVIHNYEKVIDLTPSSKSVRLDVYLDDVEGTIYNIEMQTSNQHNLPKRSRYYQGMIDLNHLEKGDTYDQLPRTFIIFICTFDVYHMNLPIYRFSNRCEDCLQLMMGDETTKIFVNLNGNTAELSPDTSVLYDYFNQGAFQDAFTAQLEQAVQLARSNIQWEAEYMEWRAYEMDHESDRRKAQEEGHAEGLAQGLAEGLEKGLEKGLAEGLVEGQTLLAKVISLLREGSTPEQLMHTFDKNTVELAVTVVNSFR